MFSVGMWPRRDFWLATLYTAHQHACTVDTITNGAFEYLDPCQESVEITCHNHKSSWCRSGLRKNPLSFHMGKQQDLRGTDKSRGKCPLIIIFRKYFMVYEALSHGFYYWTINTSLTILLSWCLSTSLNKKVAQR